MNLQLTAICAGWALLSAYQLHGQTISTAAGSTTWRGAADVALDSAGNLYVADFDRSVVYKVDQQAAITAVAGTGTAGYAGDGGPASAARISGPLSVAVDRGGNLYIAEYGGDRIRKVAPNGIITTFAGTGRAGFSGDGGPATTAAIFNPLDMAADAAGNIYFVDSGNRRIRRIGANGVITTVAGTGRRGSTGDGGPALAADIAPSAIAFGPDGSLYFTDAAFRQDAFAPKIRKISPNGTVSTVAGAGTPGYSGDGGPAISAQFRSADGVAVDSGGNVYLSDFVNCRVRKVAADGIITTFAGDGICALTGDGGEASRARVNNPLGLAIDAQNNLYIADYRNLRVRKISAPQSPSISSVDGVRPAYRGMAGFSSNSYLEIFGSNLSATTRVWSAADFVDSNAPTSLDGVSVTVNGKRAFVQSVSPGRIMINTPDDSETGPVPVQVTTALGMSNAVMANRAAVSPTLHTSADVNFGGRQYVLAQTQDFRFFVGNPAATGRPFAGVRPGETIVILALGCGPTAPAVPAGVIAAQDSPLSLPHELRIGGVAAAISSAGMIGGTIGLYQITAVVPRVGAGDQPIELTVDGVGNDQNLYLMVAN